MRELKRYLFFWLAITMLLLVTVAAFNLLVDPYRIFQIYTPSLNHSKPKAGSHGAMVKKYLVSRIYPGALIVGNSRAEVGFDPEYLAWPRHLSPVFNYALPGTGTSTSLASLKQVLSNQQSSNANRLQVLVWGIDYMDFLVASQPQLQVMEHRPDAAAPPQWLRDYAGSVMTMAALQDSLQTLIDQQNPFAQDLTVQGFNPMRDYIKITADEGYWAVFRAKDREGIKAYLSRPKTIVDVEGQSPAVADLKAVIRLCKDHDIALHLVMYPYHAHMLETLRITGHWASFEAWKRMIVGVVDAAVEQHQGLEIALWDFSGFNPLTTEDIPQRQDKKGGMRWYWEAGHFKSELGNLVLDRVFGRGNEFPEFGVLISSSNIDQHIRLIQSQAIEYRRQHIDELNELERLAVEFKAARSRINPNPSQIDNHQ